MHRRKACRWAALAAVAATASVWTMVGPLTAQTSPPQTSAGKVWPTKRVQVIVRFAPGSATDLLPRMVFEQVAANVGQTIIIENRPGGGGAIGVGAAAKAEADGHTILVHSNALVTAPAVKDLVAAAKAKPGAINYAAAGIGTPPHLTAERFRLAAQFEGQLVPFKGAPEALTEVITGRVDFYFCPLTVAMPFIREGKVLALAVSNSKRTSALQEVPTTLEAGVPDSDFDFWVGMMVPKKTPREIVARIHAETVKGLRDPSVKEKLSKLGVEEMIMQPEDFDARIAREAPIAVALAKAAGIAAK